MSTKKLHPVPTCLTEDGKLVLIKPCSDYVAMTSSEARELALKLESMADKADRNE